LFEYTEGRDCLPSGVTPKDILSLVINDASIGIVDKKKICNKLLRKAVFHGNYEIVQLVLNEAKDIGVCVCVCARARAARSLVVGICTAFFVILDACINFIFVLESLQQYCTSVKALLEKHYTD